MWCRAARCSYKSLHFSLSGHWDFFYFGRCWNFSSVSCQKRMNNAARISDNAEEKKILTIIKLIFQQHGVLPASPTLPHRVGRFESNRDESSRSLRILKRLSNASLHNHIHIFFPKHVQSAEALKNSTASLLQHEIKCCLLVSGIHSAVLRPEPAHHLGVSLQLKLLQLGCRQSWQPRVLLSLNQPRAEACEHCLSLQ